MKLRPRAQRRPTRLLVTYWRPRNESDYREGRLTDLSATGCFVATERPFPPPTTVQMRLVAGDERLDIQAEVIRTVGDAASAKTSRGTGMGLRFQQPAAEAVQKLLAYRRGV